MQHIRELVIPRVRELTHLQQLSLFTKPQEKGSSEWNAFRGFVAYGHTVYPARQPIRTAQRLVPRMPEIQYHPAIKKFSHM